eukprot:675179-Rhodomonas_salina.2
MALRACYAKSGTDVAYGGAAVNITGRLPLLLALLPIMEALPTFSRPKQSYLMAMLPLMVTLVLYTAAVLRVAKPLLPFTAAILLCARRNQMQSTMLQYNVYQERETLLPNKATLVPFMVTLLPFMVTFLPFMAAEVLTFCSAGLEPAVAPS